MSKSIKNNSGGVKTWVGQQVADGAYYDISNMEYVKWAENSLLLIDIASGDAIVAKDNSGDTDILDINEAIDFLKNIPNLIQKRQNVISQSGIQSYETGVGFTVTKDTTHDEDFLIDFKYLRGGILECENSIFPEDKITIQIVDVDNVLGAGAGTIISTYLKNRPIRISGIMEIKSEFISNEIPSGLYCRISYTSTGTSVDVKCALTLYGYNDV